jgi:hypothetical protein
MLTNADTAKRLTEIAAALTDYPHLPLITAVRVSLDQRVLLSPASALMNIRIRSVALWAQAFGVPVVLDSNVSEVRAYVELSGHPAEVYANVGHQMVYALRAALGLSLAVDEVGPTEVSPGQLLGVLHDDKPSAYTQPVPAAAPAAEVPVDTAPVVADV